MTLTWGQLAKTIEDPEKIEEAIASIVQEHNEDPEAHLGAGQSLQSHKASEIIDHLARSIVYDKFAASQLIFSTSFENPDVFSITNSPVFHFPGFNLHPTSGGFANRKAVNVNAEYAQMQYDFEKDMTFQFSFEAECLSGGSFRFKISSGGVGDINSNVGLLIDDGVAKFFFSKPDGSNTVWLNWDNWENTVFYIIRIEYIAEDEKAYFYVNNNFLGSLSCPDTSLSDPLNIVFEAFNDTLGQVDANISALTFQLEP